MPRVALPISQLTPNAGVIDPTGVALVAGAGNGLQIAAIGGYYPQTFLRIANASGGTAVVNVLAGAQPSAPSSGQGPVTVSVLTATTQFVGPFETARVQQPDGSLIIEANAVVTVTAIAYDNRRV